MEGRKCRLLTWMLSLTLCFFSLAMYGGYATQSIMTLERLWELQDAKINAHGQAVITVVDRVSTPGTEKYRSFFYDPEAGLLPIEGEDVQVADLNDEGTAVGSITLNGAYHYFTFNPATGIQVDPKMAYSRATAINSRGITAGWTLSSEHIMHEGKRYALTQAFLYRPDIGAATLKVMGDGYHRIHVSGLNNEGVLAGYADNVSGERHAYRFQVVGGSTDLGSIGPLGEVKKINANGTVLAEWGNGPMKIQEYVPPFYALLILRSGQQVQLNKLGLGNTDAVDLNDSDIIVGRVTDEDGLTRAFFGDAEGHLNFLPVPKEYATFRSVAFDLNNAGATVGAVENDPLLMTADDIPTYHALLQRWQPVIWGSVEKSAQVIRTDLRGMAVAMNETGSIVVLGFTKPESEETPSTLQVFILKPEASEPFKAAADK